MWLLCNILSHVVTDILAQSSCQKPTIPKNITLFLWWIARIFIPLYPQMRMEPHFFYAPFDFVRWFGSSVGLEQQPSKLRVKGSSPFRITKKESFKRLLFLIPHLLYFRRKGYESSPFLHLTVNRFTSRCKSGYMVM